MAEKVYGIKDNKCLEEVLRPEDISGLEKNVSALQDDVTILKDEALARQKDVVGLRKDVDNLQNDVLKKENIVVWEDTVSCSGNMTTTASINISRLNIANFADWAIISVIQDSPINTLYNEYSSYALYDGVFYPTIAYLPKSSELYVKVYNKSSTPRDVKFKVALMKVK